MSVFSTDAVKQVSLHSMQRLGEGIVNTAFLLLAGHGGFKRSQASNQWCMVCLSDQPCLYHRLQMPCSRVMQQLVADYVSVWQISQ